MNKIKYFIGPMSKNIVDAVLEYMKETKNKIGFIPSRRQIEFNGGYVNNWTTKQFSEYVDGKAVIKRDHSGPSQGYIEDDGFTSLTTDCQHFDIIHIDPWAVHPTYEDGLKWTISMICHCLDINDEIEFEIGTEESIRKFSAKELDQLVTDLKEKLSEKEFKQIKYLVIQSGTSLKETTNTGNYSKKRLKDMVKVAKKHKLISKEHNGDYITTKVINEKFKLGLDSINIAPEFGLIETQTYLDNIKDKKLFDLFYQLCHDSRRWEKWVDSKFSPIKNKTKLIQICGHYVFSNEIFQTEIKSKLKGIDTKIKKNIKSKLDELFSK